MLIFVTYLASLITISGEFIHLSDNEFYDISNVSAANVFGLMLAVSDKAWPVYLYQFITRPIALLAPGLHGTDVQVST